MTAGVATTRRTDLVAAADDDLLARVAGGDRDAWGELYRRHRATIAGYLTGRARRQADVDDLVHEAFLDAWDSADQYRPEPGRLARSWLCGRAGLVLRVYAWSRHRDRLSTEAATETLRRPVTETAEQREARPLSAPVRAAVAALAPAERRAITLRYLHGLTEEQAAEAGRCSRRAIRSSAEAGRRKLTAALADLVPPTRSPLTGMPRQHVARIALAAVGYDNVPAAEAWLRKRGLRVGTTTLYEARRAHDRAGSGAATNEHRPAPVAYTPPDAVLALAPSERARAAGRDYHTRHAHLPSISQRAAATGVAHATAARALRQLKVNPCPVQPASANDANAGTADWLARAHRAGRVGVDAACRVRPATTVDAVVTARPVAANGLARAARRVDHARHAVAHVIGEPTPEIGM